MQVGTKKALYDLTYFFLIPRNHAHGEQISVKYMSVQMGGRC